MAANNGKKGQTAKKDPYPVQDKKAYRTFPLYTLEETLVVPQTVENERHGQPMKRLLLAEGLGEKPSSVRFRGLLSSSYKYGLTEGTEKSEDIFLTQLGLDIVQSTDPARRLAALRQAAMRSPLFRSFYEAYRNARLPGMMSKVLVSEYGVSAEVADEVGKILVENGQFVQIIRDISGSLRLFFDDVPATPAPAPVADVVPGAESVARDGLAASSPSTVVTPSTIVLDQAPPPSDHLAAPKTPRAIFIAHGKKHGPLEKLQKRLTRFQIPYKVVVDEPNLARPIPQKVKDIMAECGSAILIFTCDEKFQRENGEVVWRPSENVVYELGAASYAYGDRVVIFKEKGLYFPTNFQSIGYIEFEEEAIEAKWADLLEELIGFGLVKVTTPG
jgi:predicted nucleotide-binding protein